MNKLSFPKGSLKFKKIINTKLPIEQELKWKVNLKDYVKRKEFVDYMRQTYPTNLLAEGNLEKLPMEQQNAFLETQAHLKNIRKTFKEIPNFSTVSDYEIKFKHPKWYPAIGEITLQSKRANMKDALKSIAVEFKARKEKFRKFRTKEKIIKIKSLKADLKYTISGGIIHMPHVKEGVYARFLKEQEKQIVFSEKYPKDKNNYIGIELEFICDFNAEQLGLKLFDAGVGKQVTLTTDDSIKCCGYGEAGVRPRDCTKHKDIFAHELCILTKENEYKDVMKKICQVLASTNSIVNKSCGMHVHLDMRSRNAERAYQNLVSVQNVLFKMNPKSRAEKYAKKVTNRNFEEVRNTPTNGFEYRYLGINPIAMNRHNTIEIRIHSGTTDYTKITNWIAILIKVANSEARIVKNYVSLNKFCEDFDVNDKLKTYIEERTEKFKPKKQGDIEVEPDAERGVA